MLTKYHKKTSADIKNNWKQIKDNIIWISSIWIGKFVDRDNCGDNKFHGNFHPDIVKQAVIRFTKEGDTVFDPFAGSGTTIDVCKKLNRKCISSDLNPTRDSIIKCDISNIAEVKMMHEKIL